MSSGSGELITITDRQHKMAPSSLDVLLDPLNTMVSSDSMVQPHVDRSRNINNLDLIEPNRIRDSMYAYIKLPSANILMLKMWHTCTYLLMMSDIHLMLAVTSITFFFVADVRCGLNEIKTTEQMLHTDRIQSKKCF